MAVRQLIEGDRVFLVALDATSGELRFEQRLDVRDLQQPLSLSFSREADALLLSGSKIAGGESVRINQVNRPGCFINIIPAGGLVLIPEASSGCTCAYPMQMSIAYATSSR